MKLLWRTDRTMDVMNLENRIKRHCVVVNVKRKPYDLSKFQSGLMQPNILNIPNLQSYNGMQAGNA